MIKFVGGISAGLFLAAVLIVLTLVVFDKDKDNSLVAGFCETSYDYADYLAGSVVARAVPEANTYMSPSISDADFSSKSYQIVFPKETPEGNWSLYLMRLTSGDPERLTTSADSDWYPNWSPDGKEVVFTRRVPGSRESSIYIVDTESKEDRQLIEPPEGFADQFAYWTPDGNRMVFIRENISDGPFGRQQLFLVNPDGSDLKEINLGEDGDFEVDVMPRWSPDGKFMVFAAQQIHNPEISESGNVTMRSSDNEPFLIVADADGTNQRVLAHYSPSSVASFESARFSEDGLKVIYQAWNTEGRSEIAYVDLESDYIHDLSQVCYN